jgi:hypothetical protein
MEHIELGVDKERMTNLFNLRGSGQFFDKNSDTQFVTGILIFLFRSVNCIEKQPYQTCFKSSMITHRLDWLKEYANQGNICHL